MVSGLVGEECEEIYLRNLNGLYTYSDELTEQSESPVWVKAAVEGRRDGALPCKLAPQCYVYRSPATKKWELTRRKNNMATGKGLLKSDTAEASLPVGLGYAGTGFKASYIRVEAVEVRNLSGPTCHRLHSSRRITPDSKTTRNFALRTKI